jgi:hypothetical protein
MYVQQGNYGAFRFPFNENYVLLCSPYGPWPPFQFLNPIHSRQDTFDGGLARRKAATCTQNNTNTE